jgi:heat shock protein HslJ
VPAVPDVEAVLNLSADGQVSGSLGCNHFGGDYKQKGTQIEFGSLAATLMACPEPQMLQEGGAFKIMAGSADYKIEGRTLTITKDAEVLVFESVAQE